MKQEGYLIARNRKVDTFFISSSSYDRPTWKSVNEATVYATIEQADRALKKLLGYGAYEARLVPVKEAINFELPDQQRQTMPLNVPPSDDNASRDEVDIEDHDDVEDSDSMEDPDAQSDEMTAQDSQEICDQCEHCPCTCEHDDDELASDVDSEITDGEQPAIDDLDPDSLDDLDPELDDLDPVSPDTDIPRGRPRMESVESGESNAGMKLVANSPADATNKPEDDTKVAVPGDVKSALSAAIADFKKQADNTTDDTRKSFCLTVVDSFETLQSELNKGTQQGMQMAQVKMSSWMGPIVHHLPTTVQKFVLAGGKKPTLQDFFTNAHDAKKGR